MGSKVVKKGILKPLKYFSTVFDNNPKEPEMTIGAPTDVKHVAHIGWDGPNLTAPTWMNEYHSAPLAPTGNPWGSQDSSSAPLSPNPNNGSTAEDANNSNDRPNAAPASSRPRHSRRNQSEGTINTDSTGRDAMAEGGSTKRGRRKHKKDDPQAQDGAPGVPKHTHRRRPKGSSCESGELVRSSKVKPIKATQDEQSDDMNNDVYVDNLADSLNETKVNEEDEF